MELLARRLRLERSEELLGDGGRSLLAQIGCDFCQALRSNMLAICRVSSQIAGTVSSSGPSDRGGNTLYERTTVCSDHFKRFHDSLLVGVKLSNLNHRGIPIDCGHSEYLSFPHVAIVPIVLL
jgi:hypothetical protein